MLRAALLLPLALAPLAVCQDPAPPRPNVLVVLADDLGYSDLGCYGGEIPTPHLDDLAAAGLRFTQATTSARCCPTRASLLTGLHPHQAGVGSFATSRPDQRRGPAYLGHLGEQCVTLAEALGGAGYSTWMVGKWHVGLPGPIERGFEEFYGFRKGYEQDQWRPERYERLPAAHDQDPEVEDFYATDVFTDYALSFLERARGEDRPWFLYLAHGAPHFPVQAPPSSTAKLVERYRAGWDVLAQERFERQQESGLATDAWRQAPPSLVPVDEEKLTDGYAGLANPAWSTLDGARREDLAHRMAVFAAMVAHMDEGVGRLVADLERSGELENTLIVFLSDNGACYEWGPFGFDGPSRRAGATLHEGEALAAMGGPGTYHAYGSAWADLGNTPLRLYKHFAHEGGLATPLVMHWPAGITRPRWVRDPVHVMDLMPTLLEVAGGSYPEAATPLEGVSLAPTFTGGGLEPRELCYEHQGARAVRVGNWKAVWGKRFPGEVDWELYNLAEDRCELLDLAGEHPERVEELAGRWLDWAGRVKVYPFFEGAQPAPPAPPQVADRPFTVTCRVAPAGKEGVLVAQGGDQVGYALHVEGGELRFTVRVDGPVTLNGPALPGGAFQLRARNDGSRLTLWIDGQPVAEGPSPGLLPRQPGDGLSRGHDSGSAVGTYAAPHRYAGKVTDVTVTLD